jgi:hypothetical protein
MKMLSLALSITAVLGLTTAADAAACRNAKGKFIKCPTAAAAPAKPKACRDAKGKFTKCAKPAG